MSQVLASSFVATPRSATANHLRHCRFKLQSHHTRSLKQKQKSLSSSQKFLPILLLSSLIVVVTTDVAVIYCGCGFESDSVFSLWYNCDVFSLCFGELINTFKPLTWVGQVELGFFWLVTIMSKPVLLKANLNRWWINLSELSLFWRFYSRTSLPPSTGVGFYTLSQKRNVSLSIIA